jgi:DNA-3-methyladenine glycosylase
LGGIIVETEAYIGKRDAASHAYRGRRSPRNESMYAEGGTAYVYFTYGMHWCFNVVCGTKDEPVAVLVRALEPNAGLEEMARFRRSDSILQNRAGSVRADDAALVRFLCSGPAKLCQALAIDRSLDGLDLTCNERLWIERPLKRSEFRIDAGPRIGIAYAGLWAKRKLRFWIRNNPCVSAHRRTSSRFGSRRGHG